MKKLLAVLSTVTCLFVGSNVYSGTYPQLCQDRCSQQYSDRCVGQCVDPCVGQCEAPGRFYLGAFGGANWLNLHHIKGFKSGAKGGFVGGVSLGYEFDNGFRVEGEVSYRRNHVKRGERDRYSDNYFYSNSFDNDYFYSDSSDSFSDFSFSKNGRYSSRKGKSFYSHSWAYMANLLYDFNSFSSFCPNFVPYIGFGLGYSQQNDRHRKHDDYSFNLYDSDHSHSSHRKRGRDGGFAYQGIAGLGYKLTDSTTLGVEYRYFGTQKNNHDQSIALALRQAF